MKPVLFVLGAACVTLTWLGCAKTEAPPTAETTSVTIVTLKVPNMV